jgi:hypothetical protein
MRVLPPWPSQRHGVWDNVGHCAACPAIYCAGLQISRQCMHAACQKEERLHRFAEDYNGLTLFVSLHCQPLSSSRLERFSSFWGQAVGLFDLEAIHCCNTIQLAESRWYVWLYSTQLGGNIGRSTLCVVMCVCIVSLCHCVLRRCQHLGQLQQQQHDMRASDQRKPRRGK